MTQPDQRGPSKVSAPRRIADDSSGSSLHSRKRKRHKPHVSDSREQKISADQNGEPRGLRKDLGAGDSPRAGPAGSQHVVSTSHRQSPQVRPPFSSQHAQGARVASTNGEQKSVTFPWNKSRSEHDGRKGNSQYQGLQNRRDTLLPIRKALPVWNHTEDIRRNLRDKDILLLVGETGSGKSTQVPQMLIAEPWFRAQQVTTAAGQRVGGCIAVTEPRRVAAISLARRVAEEYGTTLGGPHGKVGYSVRFEHCVGPNTAIKYLTEGMLLQEMLRDPFLKQYSAVVIDEVHERSSNVDLLLGFLKRIVVGEEGSKARGQQKLKLCVMSATADVDSLTAFFEQEDEAVVPKQEPNLPSDEEPEWEGIVSSEDEATHMRDHKKVDEGKSQYRESRSNDVSHLPNQKSKTTTPEAKAVDGSLTLPLHSNVALCHIEGRQYPVKILYAPEPVSDFLDASLRTILQIHQSEPLPGDILVFLTGQEVVEQLEELINEYSQQLPCDLPKMLVLPLFAALPQAAQQRVFLPTPKGTRKIILSTNIAETSITVSGVRFVVDCGKAKVKSFRPRVGLESLLIKPISKSAAIQRKGRAGREAAGKCFRLYTEPSYLELERNNTPEILRSDLSHAILTLKARGVGDIARFPFLSPPSHESLTKALLVLHQLGALTPDGTITSIGNQMARLPLSAQLSRSLIAASNPHLDCLDETIDIVSCLSVENLFLNPSSEERKEAATTARMDIVRREGDHLTLLAALRAYATEHTDRKAWCERRAISHRAMRSVLDVRKQLRAHFKLPPSQLLQPHVRPVNVDNGGGDDGGGGEEGLPSATIKPPAPVGMDSEKTERILRALLSGFKMNTARLVPDGRYRTFASGHQDVGIHPSSVLFGRKVECILYNEFVFTNKAYARQVSAVQMDWVGQAFDDAVEKESPGVKGSGEKSSSIAHKT